MSLSSATSASKTGDIFLQNNFVSIGVNAQGTLGTISRAPIGFNTDLRYGYARVGFYADVDGFGRGSVTPMRDAILPGTAIETFSIGYKSRNVLHVNTNSGLDGKSDIRGTNQNTSSSKAAQSTWSGATDEKVGVKQVATISPDAQYVRFDVTLTNNSGSAISDVRYLRSIDPDLNPSSYASYNKIVMQGDGKAMVTAATSETGAPMFLYAVDKRATVSIYGYENFSPYDANVLKAQGAGYASLSDTSLNLNFNIGTLASGQSTTLTFYLGMTADLAGTIKKIGGSSAPVPTDPRPQPEPEPVNTAPVAANDSFKLDKDASVSGNVLSNDKDADGHTLSASLVTGPLNGTVKLNADGSFSYIPKAGFSGTDSFTYKASDGSAADTAVVSLTVTAPVVVPRPPEPTGILAKAGTINLSSSADQIVTGASYHNAFYVDSSGVSGKDTIINFAKNDVLVLKDALYDSNGDGYIWFKNNTLDVDGSSGSDTLRIVGVSGVRDMGSVDGMEVYANASVRPKDALESKIGNDVLRGDAADSSKQIFFFDTALDIDLGNDTITNFGKRDIIVTTSALKLVSGTRTVDFGGDHLLDLVGGSGSPEDRMAAGEAGHVAILNSAGGNVTGIEYDGAVSGLGVTYYVYSATGSVAGVVDLLL